MQSNEDVPSEEMLQAARSEIFTECKKQFMAGDFSEEANLFNTALIKSRCLQEMFARCMSVIQTTDNLTDVYSCLLTFFTLGWKVGRAQMLKLDDKILTDKKAN